eukprot:m.29419 g.29419  ORF g.29419 m.29419 type:complete len:472 (+) comp8100_c0_seq2:40-1455(+)
MATTKSLLEGFEASLDECFDKLLKDPTVNIPGFVVKAKRGDCVYHKAFGYADKENHKEMQLDAQMRCFSMTKVLSATLAVMMMDEGLLKLSDLVEDYIPSFKREWQIIKPIEDENKAGGSVTYTSFVTGDTYTYHYNLVTAKKKMQIKHLISESAGISYDLWTEFGCGNEAAIAQSIRRGAGKGWYTSNTIIGQDATPAEFCDGIAKAGVLTCEPGEFSYGLGNLVLGRVVEVCYARSRGKEKRLSEIMDEMIFKPLNMQSAAFYLNDGDERSYKIPQLYGGSRRSDGTADVRPYVDCMPKLAGLPNTTATDNASGPRKCDSGDTGACMTVDDYSKFYEFLLRGGVTEEGKRLLRPQSVDAILRRKIQGLTARGPIARYVGLREGNMAYPKSFNFGWCVTQPNDEIGDIDLNMAPTQCYWNGYASNHGTLYPDDDAYILIFTQFMSCSGPVGRLVSEKVMGSRKDFLSLWS